MSRVFVTGASSGIGLAIATGLIADGHYVVVHGEHLANFSDTTILSDAHDIVFGDLSVADGVEAVANRAEIVGRFDAVIHCATAFAQSEAFTVNTVAPYILTARMRRPRRIIMISSAVHRSGSNLIPTLDPDDDMRVPYEDTKLYLTALAMAIAARWSRVMVHAVEPGLRPTRLDGSNDVYLAEDDPSTPLWLATASTDEIVPRSGGYWYQGRTQHPHDSVTDPAFQDAILRMLSTYTGMSIPL